jgi:chemotaxis protein CheZ
VNIMAGPRKVFRIEETAATRPDTAIEDNPAALLHAEIMHELNALRAVLATPLRQSAGPDASPRIEIARLASELHLIHAVISGTQSEPLDLESRLQTVQMTRVAHELDAVMKGSEQATQKILAAAEDIDQAANNLSAALKGEIEQGLAQDIQDRVIQIFEACNFQDLTCQRVAKVMATLDRIEGQITRVLAELTRADGTPAVHGPPLESDRGHVSQSDIDSLFGARARSA